MSTVICDLCNRRRNIKWYLQKYFGITGKLCGQCYETVSHSSTGLARHPKRYRKALVKLTNKL